VYRLKLSNENLLSNPDYPVSALVPILVDGAACAVIVLFRLFPHKPGSNRWTGKFVKCCRTALDEAIEPQSVTVRTIERKCT